jgi:response regulator of citrate/malate metabolism
MTTNPKDTRYSFTVGPTKKKSRDELSDQEFYEALDFLSDTEDLSQEEMDALLQELDDEVEDESLIPHGSERKTITGVVKVMKEEGRQEGAELLEEMRKVAKQTGKLKKVVKRKAKKKRDLAKATQK